MTVIPTKEHVTQVIRSGGAFSEDETPLHGQLWIDGKQIYRKVVDFGALPNTTTKFVSHGITGLSQVISFLAMSESAGAYRVVPFIDVGGSRGDPYIDITGGNVAIRTNFDGTGYTTTYVILEYTKT